MRSCFEPTRVCKYFIRQQPDSYLGTTKIYFPFHLIWLNDWGFCLPSSLWQVFLKLLNIGNSVSLGDGTPKLAAFKLFLYCLFASGFESIKNSGWLLFPSGSKSSQSIFASSFERFSSDVVFVPLSNGSFAGIQAFQNVEQCFPMQKNITMKLTNEQVNVKIFCLLM